MTDSEKGAIWILGVVALTITAYFALVALRGNGPATLKAFALVALIAFHKGSWRILRGQRLDERERDISRRALLASFRALFAVVVVVIAIMGRTKGMEATLSLPVWLLTEALWWAGLLALAVQSTTTLVLYRRGNNA